ncbi:Dopamine N-acetyltransferase [Orchesella cincta]|uniref:Dopamine N-acetyltransferase n=1 Tax=Orchesella cincta TaxID=48709 RepID=A0A1D2MK86_ORCCI|nr:Dopamine N-acetyltransferase [Orchesella cincta]
MDHSELGEPFENFSFKFIEPHEYEAVLKVLEGHLYQCMEPMGYKAEMAEDWNGFFKAMLHRGDNLSYMAVDTETGQIASIRMVDHARKGKTADFPPMKHKANVESMEICEKLCENENLYEKYDITEYGDMFGLVTVSDYRQRGLAGEMYRRGLHFLKKRGFKIVKCGFVSPFTRRAGKKHGYKEFARRRFLECIGSDGKILNPNADDGPDGYICFGIFDLRD